MALPDIAVVAAVDENSGIGRDGSIPWRNSADFQWFKTLTTHIFVPGKKNAVVMGTKTWNSLPKALPERLNVVVSTRSRKQEEVGVEFRVGLRETVASLVERDDIGKIFIIGGGTIYNQALSLGNVKELYLSRVKGVYDCDTFFPLGSYRMKGFFENYKIPVGDRGLDISLKDCYNKQELIFKKKGAYGILEDA